MGLENNTLRELAIRVSQYFLDFLESDFKRQQAPRRRIVLQNDSGFRSGMRIAPYPEMQRDVWRLLEKVGAEEGGLKIAPRSYRRPITATLRAIIKEQVLAIAEESINAIRAEVIQQAQSTRGKAIENPEAWVDQIRGALASEIGTQLIRPLLAMLDGPLSQQAYSSHDSIFSTETELIELVAAKIDRLLPEVLSRYLATGDMKDLREVLFSVLTIDDTREVLAAYFENFMASDAYPEFRDLETYAATGEALQLYLYVGSLRYGNFTFPVFYVPIDVQRQPDTGTYSLALVNHLYANKRAIDFVLQEVGQRQKREWLSPIKERIRYLAPDENLGDAAKQLFAQIANALDLGGEVELSTGAVREASNTNVALSSALHFAVFDRSDEALLNDYEEMITQARKNEPGVVGLFEGIVRGVLLENPKSIHEAVEDEWDALPLVDRVVIDSPVPLNEEQIKILAAIRKPEGKIIVVEGPPGTGKSHTITAIAADSALRGRSCLILSDKTEALNVVQDKLSQAMSQARHDKQFPNPILRLGQDQANFKRLVSSQSLTQVSAYARANKSNQPRLKAEMDSRRARLQQNIEQTVGTLGMIGTDDIAAAFAAEARLEALAPGLPEKLRALEAPALSGATNAADSARDQLSAYWGKALGSKQSWNLDEMRRALRLDACAATIAEAKNIGCLNLIERFSAEDARKLSGWLLEFDQLRMPVFGYLFRGAALRSIEQRLNGELTLTRPLLLKRDHEALRAVLACIQEVRSAMPASLLGDSDLADLYGRLLEGRQPPACARTALQFFLAVEAAAGRGNFPDALLTGVSGDEFAARWTGAAAFLLAWHKVSDLFARAPEFDYVSAKSQLEQFNVTAMNAEVDNRLVSFMNNFKTDAKILASIISNRQKFPEDKFENVKESFPVIIASIRQFGEYMPLAPDIFDVVVIDEASQVSVAQAFPALLRAKKVVVLGDSKQFSNTKSTNASIALNEKYRSELEAFFRQRVSQEASMLQRLAKFDVKCSILEFCQLCANYSTMLRKHFRSYQELISYSSETFYNGQLQAIKIRGVPLDDVIRFDQVEVEEGQATRGTNEAEAKFILERLLELLDEEEPPSVGVITPFREQQALLSKTLFSHAKGAEFQDRLRLKVMTFDSCQGEERKIIFYSMVATATHDLLNYVFPVDLKDAQEVVEEKLKAQRLNVGFSRAEELVWFVHSKPLDQFKGTISRALNHYANILERGEVKPDRTDANSPMEQRVLDWLQKTPFFQQHRDQIEILPQFPIGAYLRQLDPTYKHPAWRVDFLLTFTTPKGMTRIVLEYDGFDHHFEKGKDINVGNHERYMVAADVERQLTLESYGYRFLRINRFNLGKDPVQTLSDRLSRLVERLVDQDELRSVREMQAEAEGLATKRLKQCPNCGKNKPMGAFYDDTLRDGDGGYGRVCMTCKYEKAHPIPKRAPTNPRRWRRRYR